MSTTFKRPLLFALALCVAPAALVAAAETSPPSSEAAGAAGLILHNRSVFGGVRTILTLAAEMMPEETYDFRPTEDVRTFGEIVGHVADSQYAFCSVVRGEEGPAREAPDPRSRAAMLSALEEAFAYCGAAYDGLTETSATETVTFQGGPTPRLGVLTVNQIHTIEHYGNLVTYLRMNGIVPPTSDPEVMKQLLER